MRTSRMSYDFGYALSGINVGIFHIYTLLYKRRNVPHPISSDCNVICLPYHVLSFELKDICFLCAIKKLLMLILWKLIFN